MDKHRFNFKFFILKAIAHQDNDYNIEISM